MLTKDFGLLPGMYKQLPTIESRVLGIVIAAMLIFPLLCSAQDHTLTSRQIAAANEPGVVRIDTTWTAKAQVPHWVLPQENLNKLAKLAGKLIEEKEIPASKESARKAMLQELADNPFYYLRPGPTILSKDVKTSPFGSGFIITTDGYVLTNTHVVEESDQEKREQLAGNLLDALSFQQELQIFQKILGAQLSEEEVKLIRVALLKYYLGKMQITPPQRTVAVQVGIAIPGLPTLAKPVVADVRKTGEQWPGKDVAILKIEQQNLPTVPLGDDSTLGKGDWVYVLGFPGAAEQSRQIQGVESTFTSGPVSARNSQPGGWQSIQVQTPIHPGNSGGPAFNDRGEAIGIAVAVATVPLDSNTRVPLETIGYLIPIRIAKQFLSELNVKPQEGRLSKLYRDGIAEMDGQCYRRALDKFKEIGELNPGFPFVQDKITQSRVAIAQGLDRCWMPRPTYIAASVAALLIVLTAVWFLMRPRTVQVGVPSSVGSTSVTAGAAGATARVIEAQVERGPIALPGGTAALPARSFGSLQCTAGPVLGRRFEISNQGLLIGRDSTKCQIVLADENVSKEHAWIVPVEEGIVVIDRGSTNGTFVNSVDSPKVSKIRLHHGDRIFIGKGVATFTYQSS
jgi:serine protease Do